MKKILFSAALLMGLATVSFAGNPKGETKEAKPETPTEAKSQQDESFTYYVTGQTTINSVLYYTVQTNAPLACGSSGSLPCQVTSSDEKDGSNRIPASAVESVDSHRISY